MTRQEAIDKLGLYYMPSQSIGLINALEALGLLKFEEEKHPQCDELRRHGITNDNLKSLDAAGYKIVKQGIY